MKNYCCGKYKGEDSAFCEVCGKSEVTDMVMFPSIREAEKYIEENPGRYGEEESHVQRRALPVPQGKGICVRIYPTGPDRYRAFWLSWPELDSSANHPKSNPR
jgi:hypothetical protein